MIPDAKLIPKLAFCVKFLKDNGYDASNLHQLQLFVKKLDKEYDFVEVKKDFYTELAEKMRELWPPGEKDGKWPWRDSVSNLSIRLRSLWTSRNLKDYTIEECLTVARRYLVQFEDNAKYMMTLKYFIMKQDKLVGKDGRINYINKSVFADMLESVSSTDDEWNTIFESTSTTEQGELI